VAESNFVTGDFSQTVMLISSVKRKTGVEKNRGRILNINFSKQTVNN